MLIDPLVLKKKLNRMATEQGAFAVLSSLLLYVTELAACDPQLRSKRTKWEEGKENQVSCKQWSPDSNRGRYPTRFQLLRSRFLNNNREPYVKKRREVGKLVIKERLWVNRASNKLERRGDGKAEEGEDTVPSERVRWGSVSGKNTVKNILKKFLAAEEKEDKEKIPTWKKKGPNSSLPKIVNRSSVLSKLKEQFEQSSLCSATEVKASLLRKGEKKMKTIPSRKAIRKPEVRVLRMAALAATDINSPESQYLVCSTVPVPRLSMATEINHPWSWSKNNATMQPCDHNTGLKEKGNSERKPGESKTPLQAAQDTEDKEEPVAPKEMPDAKDSAETNTDSSKQRPHFNPSLDSSFSICKNKALADCDALSSKHNLDCDSNKLSAGPDTSSLIRTTKSMQHAKDDSPPSNIPHSSTAEGSGEPSPQDMRTSEIPKIIMHVYSLEEVDQDFTEPEKDPFFAGQKCFPEQNEMENTLPFYSPGDQALCEVEPPIQDRHLSCITQAANKRPPAVQKEAAGLGGRGSKEDKEREKYNENKMYSTSSRSYSDISAMEEQENKTPNCQMQNEPQTKQPQSPQMPSPQNHFSSSNAALSNPDANQTKLTLSSSDLQEQKPGASEEHVPSDWEKKEGPLPDEFVRHKLYFVDEDLGKDQLPSSNEMMSPSNNGALDRSTFTDLETRYKPSNNFIECEETTADELPWPDSEVWLSPSPSSNPLTTLMSGIAGQRIHYTLGNPPALPPTSLVTPGAGGVGDEYASHGSEKHPPPFSDESTVRENNAAVEKKTACDFNNQPLSPNHSTENEYAAAEETITCQSLENCLSFSTKKVGKHANKTVLARNPLLLLEKNQTQISDDTLKQGSDMLEENLFPSSELVSGQKKCAKGTDNVCKREKHKPLPSDSDTKHGNDRMETEEIEELDVLYKFEQEQVSTPSDLMDHDNNSSSGKNAHSPQTSQLPPSERDTNIQGVRSSGHGLKCLTPTSDFIKREHDMTVDGNICHNNEKHQLSSSSEPARHTNDTAGKRNIKLNFKDYSVLPRNTARHDDKTGDGENTFQDMKDNIVQHERSFEGERNTSCDPKNQMPSSSALVKRNKKFSPLDTRQQTASGDSVKPETKLSEKKTKHISEKPQSPSSNTAERPQERSSSAEKKQKAVETEDVQSPKTKAVTGDDEHQQQGQHQLPLSSKSAKPGKNIPGAEKQQTSTEDFTVPDSNAKEKKKFLRPRKYRSVSSETVVLPQEKHSPDQKQQTSATAGFKKPETDVVKEKDEEPNSEKLLAPPSNKGVNFKEKNSSGERKQKTSVAGDVMTPKTKVAKEDDEHQHSGNQRLPPSSKPAKPGKKIPGEQKKETVTEGFRKHDTNSVKDRSNDTGSGMCRSSSPELLSKLQETNVTAKKKPSTPPSDKKIMDRTGSTEKRSGPWGAEEYQRQPSDKIGKHNIDSSGKEGSESYQTALPSGGVEPKSNSVPKETGLFKTEKSSKSSLSHDASKYDDSPSENSKKQPGFKKYRALSSKGLVKDERGAAGREAGWQAAGTASGRKEELGDCSRTAPFSKYTVESYSEGPLDSSFKPLIIRVTDTFKHHS